MTFTGRIEKLLGANHIKEVIDEFLKFLSEVPQSKQDARNDANQLRGQIIVLSGRFTDLNTKINTNTINADDAGHEKALLINSFVQILNQIPSNYPDLNIHLEEKNEDDEWSDAQKANSIEGYQVYFNKYPNGKYKADTIKLISHLEEVRQKQDDEIKRLALVEKERREKDKLSAEPTKTQGADRSQPTYQPAASQGSPPPARSKKKLFAWLAVAVAAVVIIIIVSNTSSSTDQPAPISNVQTLNDSTPAEAYNIDTDNYYVIENRSNSRIITIAGGTKEIAGSVVSVNPDSVIYDYQKFLLKGLNPFVIISKLSGEGIYIDENNLVGQTGIPEPALNSQLFRFTKFKDGYFQIEDNVQAGYVLGLDPASEDFATGQKIISMKNDNSLQTQWKLVPTDEKVNQ